MYDIDPNFCRTTSTSQRWKAPNATPRCVPNPADAVDPQATLPQINVAEYHTGAIPWKDLPVVITGKHDMKGQRANVVDVNITLGDTKSGLRISVVMYNAISRTSVKENLDYANVLDER